MSGCARALPSAVQTKVVECMEAFAETKWARGGKAAHWSLSLEIRAAASLIGTDILDPRPRVEASLAPFST